MEIKEQNTLPNTDVYRIFNLKYLIDDIDNEVMTFAHPSCFDDIKEYRGLDLLFVQSWSKEPDLPAMWDIYSKNKDNVMIKFNATHYAQVFQKFGWANTENTLNTFKPFPFHSYWKDVEYDLEDFEDNMNKDPLEHIFHKRKGYDYEKECRWVIDLRNYEWTPYLKNEKDNIQFYPKIETHYIDEKYRRIIKVPFSKTLWQVLIDEIIIDPRANDDYFQYVRDIFALRLNIRFNNPELPRISNLSTKGSAGVINITRSAYYGKSKYIEFDHLMSDINKIYYLSNAQFNTLDRLLYTENEVNLIIFMKFYHEITSSKHRFTMNEVGVFEGTPEYQYLKAFLSTKDTIKIIYAVYFLILKIIKMIMFNVGVLGDSRNNEGSLISKTQEIFNSLIPLYPEELSPYLNDTFIIETFEKLSLQDFNIVSSYYDIWNLECRKVHNLIYELLQDKTAIQHFENKPFRVESILKTLATFLIQINTLKS